MENKNEETLRSDATQVNEPVSLEKNEKQGKYIMMTEQEFEEAKLKQNLLMGVTAGIVAGIVCAVLWAVIAIVTEYKIGYAAIGVGALVGFAIRSAGKGITNTFGIVAAVIALLSCLAGDFLILVGFAASEFNLSYTESLSFLMNNIGIVEVFKESFQAMDLLFYVLAVYAGYSFAFKKVAIKPNLPA